MAVYTCYEMIPDCRAGKPEGWIWFVENILSPCRMLIQHYGGGEEAIRGFVQGSRQWLPGEEPAPVRELITRWRPRLLAAAPPQPSSADLDLETLTEAFADLMPLERMMFWLETMSYSPAETARILHVAEDAVVRARDKSAELLRARLDTWSRSLPKDCGAALGEAARNAVPEEPVTFRQLIEVIDGRLTWQGRMEVDRKLNANWYDIDFFCRVYEADYATVHAPKIAGEGAQPYLDLLGVERPKPSFWKRVLASR